MTFTVILLTAFSVLVSFTTSPGPGFFTLMVTASSAAKAPPAANRPAARSARNRRMLLLRGGTGWADSGKDNRRPVSRTVPRPDWHLSRRPSSNHPGVLAAAGVGVSGAFSR